MNKGSNACPQESKANVFGYVNNEFQRRCRVDILLGFIAKGILMGHFS